MPTNLRSYAFSPFSTFFCHFCIFTLRCHPYFILRCHLFFILRCHLFFFINSCSFSYCLSFLLPDGASGRHVVNSTVCCSTVFCSLDYYTSILFVQNKCLNFFSVSHFFPAILVLSARFGAPSCCCNFAFCSTTYVRPLCNLSLLAFVTFVFSHFAVTHFS